MRVSGELETRCSVGVCDGSGWILGEDDVARPCACRERAIAKNSTKRLAAGIPKRFRGVSFDRRPICDIDPSILSGVRTFIRRIDENLDSGRGLWFHGDVGTGKTSLAMLVAKAVLDRGRTVAVYSVPHLLAVIRRTFQDDSGESYGSLFELLTAVDLLVLDDLGAERQTEWVLEQLYCVVNERWQNEASILVTTNTPKDDGVVRQLQSEVEELRTIRRVGAPEQPLRELTDRLAQLVAELKGEASIEETDAVSFLRARVGARTVSRLVEICDGPIPVMGYDLRVAGGL